MYLSTTLIDAMKSSIDQWKKVILYLNKRGAFSSLVCSDCSYLFECEKCDTSISVHHHPKQLMCHLCGDCTPFPITCKNCQWTNLKWVGTGTQQIETSLKNIFPKNEIYRFDSDSVKTKTWKVAALQQLKNADIIIGTKMITTGFDFENVGVIGVILLEQELSFPQYNIEEKVFTNIKQLLWRGERKWVSTDFIIQTFIPENAFVRAISEGNYKDFLSTTLQERKVFSYPPFVEMYEVKYRDISKEKALNFIHELHKKISSSEIPKDIEIQLVEVPFKKNNQYHYKIIIKGKKLRIFLKPLEQEILRNPKLSLVCR